MQHNALKVWKTKALFKWMGFILLLGCNVCEMVEREDMKVWTRY